MKKNWKKLFCRLLAGTMAGVLLMGTAGCKGGEKEEKEKKRHGFFHRQNPFFI